MKVKTRIVTAGLVMLLSPLALAHPPMYEPLPPDVPRLVLSAGLSAGGDDLATASYGYGGEDDLEAGGGVYLGGGVEFPFYPGDMALRTTVGYQFDSINARNGDASFDRVPWEALLLLGPGPHRFGVGLAYHTDVRYEYSDDYGLDIDAEFDDATGLVLAYEYRFAPSFALAVRYTDIEYEETVSTGQRARVVDGSGVGVAAHLIF